MRLCLALTALVCVVGLTPTAAAQDALRGKRYYLDTARLTGAAVGCVDCHRGLPPGLFGIGRAANSPAVIANAVNAIPQMAPLRGRLAAGDIADLAAYIGNPSVPSPVLRISTRAPGGAESSDRLDFEAVAHGATSERGVVLLINIGALPLKLTSSARIVGPQAAEYVLGSSSCRGTTVLGPGESCEVGITFQPAPGSAGLRVGAVQVDHDWVFGIAAVALLGTAQQVVPRKK